MYISTKDWKEYIKRLSALDEKAGELMQEWIRKNGFSDTDAMTRYAYAIVQKYGEGSAALSAEMYDAVASMQDKLYEPAEAAAPADYPEVAKTVNGILKHSQNPDSIAGGVSRLVKRTGADTTLNNALRDGAEFARVPNGDTCAFCITLASRGWQKMSKKALKNGHAEHIHANCDCTYSIRFDGKGGVAGYDPQVYQDMYYAAEGDTPQERINSLRRMHYENYKNVINMRKRAIYAQNKLLKERRNDIISEKRYVNTGGHRNEESLTDEQYLRAEHAARKQGFAGTLGRSETQNTSVTGFPNLDGGRDRESSLLIIGTDAYPSRNGRTANEKLTLDCCMAHEVVGHHEAWLKHQEQSDPILEEAQASLRASFFGVGLTDEERDLLYQDAIDRLENAGIDFNDVKDKLHIKER